MSTGPCWIFSSRTPDGVSIQVILSAGMPSSSTMILAISTSKPSGWPDRPLSPNRGWSNFVPIVIFWAC